MIIVTGAGLSIFYSNSTDIYIKTTGDNTEVSTIAIPFIHGNTNDMNDEIAVYASNEMFETNSTPESIKKGVEDIAEGYGYEDIDVNIESQFGVDRLPILFHVSGTSMIPTFQDGEYVIAEKTDNFSVGDCVVANHSQYGLIIKRVSKIEGDQVYLTSDNKEVKYEYYGDYMTVSRGLETWIDRNRIIGVVRIHNVTNTTEINF